MKHSCLAQTHSRMIKKKVVDTSIRLRQLPDPSQRDILFVILPAKPKLDEGWSSRFIGSIEGSSIDRTNHNRKT